MDSNRIAAALKAVADRMDTLTNPDRLATRDAIISVVSGDGDAFTDEFARIWDQDGPEAANAWARDGHALQNATLATLFPGSTPFRAVPGAELRSLADRLTAA